MSDSLRLHGLWPTKLLRPGDFPGKSTGVGCHLLLQRIFPTQGSNPGLPHCRQTLYHLSHQVSPHLIIAEDLITLLIQPMKRHSKKWPKLLKWSHFQLKEVRSYWAAQSNNKNNWHILCNSMICVFKVSQKV